ncbi:MAG TPA: acyltransferase [Candidatus Acidoferrales bacterium]|nr:acyltransferase [Candidatus Acidoferrales bacterium]
MSINRSVAFRHLHNRWRFQDLSLDPTANVRVDGHLSYGKNVSFDIGCNVIVPTSASLDIGDDCYIGRYVELGPSDAIAIGNQVSIQDRSIIVGDVTVASYCVLSLNVLLTSGRHYFDRWPHILIRDQDKRVIGDSEAMKVHSRPILLGEDCWLGMNAVVMPGVTVGRGCVIGANAVVTRDLPPYSVAVGAPARIIKQRLEFSPPAAIDWRCEEHIPYFYRGFALSDRERRANASLGGHAARSDFALWLAGTRPRTVTLRVKNIESGNTTIIHGEQTAEVGNDWTEVTFHVGEVSQPTEFRMSSAGVVVGGARQA